MTDRPKSYVSGESTCKVDPKKKNGKPTVFMLRQGAYGDHIHMTPVIKAFDQMGYHITFLYNYKGAQIHSYNPRIDVHEFFEHGAKDITAEHLKAHHERLIKATKDYDVFVNFQRSLEGALIAGEDVPEYFWPLWKRRAKNARISYQDQSMKWAGLTSDEYKGWTGELWYKSSEHRFVRKYLEPFKDNYLILWAFRGSMYQKAMHPLTQDICDEFIARNPNTIIFTTGDQFCQQWEWDHPEGRVIHRSGRIPFRQALLMARYVDLVVTPETGLGIGAGAYGTPKIMLLTAASITNIVGNDKNDYSLQSDAYCSPCTRAIYNTHNCPVNPGTDLPICVDFGIDRVIHRMEQVKEECGYARNWSVPFGPPPVYV